MRLYLAHPLELRKEIREIELRIEEAIGIELVNPFYDSDGRDDIHRIDNGELTRDSLVLDYKRIVEKDLGVIDSCDGIVAYIKKGQYSIGTICEMWDTVNCGRIPVYVVSPDCCRHPWVRYATTTSEGAAFRCWEDFEDYFRSVDDEESY